MTLSLPDITIVFVALSLSTFLYYTTVRVPRGLQLPPGPPGHPIWGNLKDFPSGTLEYTVYEKWAKKYGDLVYLNILGQSILLINSADMERALFNRRGAVYSDRSKTSMMHDLTNIGESALVAMNYGEQWTRRRALLNNVLSLKNLISYHPILEANARFHCFNKKSFVQRLIPEPVNDLKLTRYMVGGFIMQFAYGINVLPENDPYLEFAERFMCHFTQALVPGAYMVDSIPLMKYLPSWFPGLEFPKVAKELNESFRDMLNAPYEYAKKSFMQGNYKPSYVSDCLEDLANTPNPSDDAEEVIRGTAVNIYFAGIDTLETQIRLFFLAMALYPDVQKKAQEELDRIIGRDSLPSFSDIPNLPYVNALCSESLRWHPVAPIGVPHQLKEADVINGYFIPKGTICFGNSWLLLRSDKEFGPDTHEFRPERFLDGSAKLKPDFAFGSGRRKCPGKALAETSLSIMAATVLHVTNISALEDEPLYGIDENQEFAPGIVARPRDFKCRIDARPDAQKLLN